MALSLAEARQILTLCATAGIKTDYLSPVEIWGALAKSLRSSAVGRLATYTRYATARPSMLRVGTHLVDTMLWFNGGQRGLWVMGQAHGTAICRGSSCPDHMGVIQFANGVRGLLECGTLAPHVAAEDFWLDDAVTVYGSHGYVRAGIGSGWQALTVASGDSCSLARLICVHKSRVFIVTWLTGWTMHSVSILVMVTSVITASSSSSAWGSVVWNAARSTYRLLPIPTTPELTRLEKCWWCCNSRDSRRYLTVLWS